MSHRAWGLLAAVVVLVGLAIWQPWQLLDDGETPDTPRTIVLLTLDALRRDHVSAYAPDGARPPVRTPHIDAIAARGVRFTDARTPVPLTLPSHTTMLAGRPPAETGVRLNSMRVPRADARPYALLQERLRSSGWRSGAFVSAATLARNRGLDAGFDVYDDGGLGDVTGSLEVPERAGDLTVASALAFVDSAGSAARVFLFVHLFEPHFPYASGSYAGDVADCDRIVGLLVEGLRAAGRLDDAVFLVTADHGEALGELGERTHGILLQDSVMRLPFILAAPGTPPAVRDGPTDAADVGPTLARFGGVSWALSEGPGAGRDLTRGAVPADRPRIAESLYGHHRYGWAQLVGAAAPDGLLVDAGAGRSHWLPIQRFGHALTRTWPGPDAPGLAGKNARLVAYRAGEDAGLMDAGPQAGGYGAGGVVAPFLPGEENARLGDPHVFVANADVLDQLAADLVVARKSGDKILLRTIADALSRLLKADPENREGWFRLGRTEAARGRFEDAESAFLTAWELGRRDEGTLLRCCGVNAEGREAEMLVRLKEFSRQVERTFQVCLMEAMFQRALGHAEALERVCAEARALATTERDRERLERVCGTR